MTTSWHLKPATNQTVKIFTTRRMKMQTMKASLMMDKICDVIMNTVMLAAIPAAAIATLIQAL
jgi:hypothetical protein